jgi:transcriptional regulator with XRE-family HTH domain
MTNREKFDALITKDKNNTLARVADRVKNRKRLKESRAIAIKVLTKLDELGWSQKRLAKEMEVSPQQITKIVSGKANLTLQTQSQLQDILDIPILATWYEDVIEQLFSKSFSQKEKYTPPTVASSGTSTCMKLEVEPSVMKVQKGNVKFIFETAA